MQIIVKTFKRVNAGALRGSARNRLSHHPLAKLYIARYSFYRRLNPPFPSVGVVFFNLTPGPARPLLPPRPPCEVITKLHECVHRISIKTNTVLPSEREGYFRRKIRKVLREHIGDHIVRETRVRYSCSDKYFARVFARTCVFI